ncbi:biliverdin-producing heme oxygenase [Sphingomonas sp.]|uniref:biliverdin-producing heme oxygenase n=1 Tax=Sphingomonas sp. TaxID=28214 RepID=UPI003751C0E1
MTARAALKAATRDAHERVDKAFGAHDLATRAGYARFLLGQAAALAPIEQALTEAGAALLIEAWHEHRRAPLLTADLAALGLASPSPVPAPRFADEAELAGGLYVLEGSRMGGAILRRAVPDCFPSAFLSARQHPGRWTRFAASLDTLLYSPQRRDAAVGAASRVFTCFEQAARQVVEA